MAMGMNTVMGEEQNWGGGGHVSNLTLETSRLSKPHCGQTTGCHFDRVTKPPIFGLSPFPHHRRRGSHNPVPLPSCSPNLLLRATSRRTATSVPDALGIWISSG